MRPPSQRRQKVKQIVVNLLSNALKFTHQGGIDITVQHDPYRAMVSVSVSDTGIGIAPEHHERIFEDSVRWTIRRRGSTVAPDWDCDLPPTSASLGGRITLRSNLGQGSTFTLTIPWNRRNEYPGDR